MWVGWLACMLTKRSWQSKFSSYIDFILPFLYIALSRSPYALANSVFSFTTLSYFLLIIFLFSNYFLSLLRAYESLHKAFLSMRQEVYADQGN